MSDVWEGDSQFRSSASGSSLNETDLVPDSPFWWTFLLEPPFTEWLALFSERRFSSVISALSHPLPLVAPYCAFPQDYLSDTLYPAI